MQKLSPFTFLSDDGGDHDDNDDDGWCFKATFRHMVG